ncbi:MAG: hypothetical protein WCU88_08410 [Elusimicrobiota bacterium]|jgi:hypothetical protein
MSCNRIRSGKASLLPIVFLLSSVGAGLFSQARAQQVFSASPAGEISPVPMSAAVPLSPGNNAALLSLPVFHSQSAQGGARVNDELHPILPADAALRGRIGDVSKTSSQREIPAAFGLQDGRAARDVPVGRSGSKVQPGISRTDERPAPGHFGEQTAGQGLKSQEFRGLSEEAPGGGTLIERAEKTAAALTGRVEIRSEGERESMPGAEAFPESKTVILVLAVTDDFMITPRFVGDVAKMYRAAYPERQVRVLHAGTRHEARKLLQGALLDGEMISHLFINTHGEWRESAKKKGSTVSVLLQGIGRFSADMDTRERRVNSQFKRFFAPIRKRLLDGAHVTFGACDQFSGPRKHAILRAQAVLDYFGLRSGEIYGASSMEWDAVKAGDFFAIGWSAYTASGADAWKLRGGAWLAGAILLGLSYFVFSPSIPIVLFFSALAALPLWGILLFDLGLFGRNLFYPPKGMLVRRLNGRLRKPLRLKRFDHPKQWLGI